VTRTLLADEEGLYDPRAYNDRLLLGLKGTMSEAEIHIMKQRLSKRCTVKPSAVSFVSACRPDTSGMKRAGW